MILTKNSIKEILSQRFCEDTHTKLAQMPSPMLFKDMEKAVERIKKAYENGEKITIVGDYDADGIISSVILSEFFDKAKINYDVYIPNRFSDGYGLNASIVDNIDSTLIITVDNGITANEAAKKCHDKNIDLIITDHHTIPNELPDAYAIINAKQSDCAFPCKEICGAEVAWYLCAAVKEKCEFDIDLSYWLDYLAIAIMADMMELVDLNRILVKKGIKKMSEFNRPALQAIRDMYNKQSFESDDISFLIAPLINSTGRMDDAKTSYEFLRCTSYEKAMDALESIVETNNLRKKQESELFEESLKMVDKSKKIIVVWGEEWHEGVIGIVASRLSRRYGKPAIVFSVKNGVAKGSARSVGDIDILSIIANRSDLLIGCGGHKGAAGVSIDEKNLPEFRLNLQEDMENIKKELFKTNVGVLGEIDPEEIDFELLSILKHFEPYGEKNPRPSFIIRQIGVKSNRFIGRDKNHLKLILKSKNKTLESLFFNFNKHVRSGSKIDILFTVSKNSYKGLVTPQLLIKEIL